MLQTKLKTKNTRFDLFVIHSLEFFFLNTNKTGILLKLAYFQYRNNPYIDPLLHTIFISSHTLCSDASRVKITGETFSTFFIICLNI